MLFEEIIINQILQSYASPLLNLFFKVVTYFGHPALWFFVSAWLFWLGKEKKSFALASLILFTGFIAGALKMIIAQPRPSGILIMEHETSYAFPSGHSTVAGALSAYAWCAKEIQKNYKYILIILALLTGVSRLYLGVHYISDVIAGLFIGAILGIFVYKLEARTSKMHFHISKIKDEFLVVAFFVIVILFYLFVPAEFYSSYALFGYFSGYAILRHVNPELQRAATKKQELVAVGVGTIILGMIGLVAYFVTGLGAQVIFFTAGLFVTIIWPVVIAKVMTKREEQKAQKKNYKNNKK